MAWDYGRRGVAGSARAVCAVYEVPSFTLWTLSDSNRFDRNNLIALIGDTNRFTFLIPLICLYYLITAVIGKTHELLRQVHDYQESALDLGMH
ncbi:hypothetical protein ASPBRDRAFT_460888 [Aspergillus brasiliensis CBS 101740]|uniref:Uncharacterized protein n=1 Tax=Aspergillus brasiliensis (strain CBS 101740 / IMI 381727 / IBT 21946) TaxID=767769 RepID=A0A1L9USS6_ASPBC|nr:hypothetical protein ASPBRDRAFT_460888 [Aspergillus brasiliensis CBS 101740]